MQFLCTWNSDSDLNGVAFEEFVMLYNTLNMVEMNNMLAEDELVAICTYDIYPG